MADGRVLKLIESCLTAGGIEGLSKWKPSAGAPQGAVISPLLSNIYLDGLDHLMAGRGWEMRGGQAACRRRRGMRAALNRH